MLLIILGLLRSPCRKPLIKRFYSCCGCSSAGGSAVDGWTWSVSSCCLWSRRPGWPASKSVRASWRRSCRWPWRRTWGGTWWRRAAAACRWGGPACTTQWLYSRGPAGWTLQRGRRTVSQDSRIHSRWIFNSTAQPTYSTAAANNNDFLHRSTWWSNVTFLYHN